MEYQLAYVVFGLLFTVGAIGYWVVTYKFKDPNSIYMPVSSPSS